MLYFREAALIIVDLCTRGTVTSQYTGVHIYIRVHTKSSGKSSFLRIVHLCDEGGIGRL